MLYKMRVKQTRLLLKRWKVDWEGNVWQDVHEQWEWEQPWEDCQQKSIQELWRTSQWADWGWCECIKSQVKALKQGLQLLHYMQEWPDPISCSWTRGSVRREKKKNLLHFILKVWRKSVVIESKLLEVQYEASTFSDDLGYHVTCWCWWLVQAAGWLSEDFRALHLLTSFMQMLNLFFQQALAPAHWTKTTTKYVLNMVAPSSIGQPTHPSWTP